MEKILKCLSLWQILSCNFQAGSVRVTVSNGQAMTAALEDVRPNIIDDTYSEANKCVLDALDQGIGIKIEDAFLAPTVHSINPSDQMNGGHDASFEGIYECSQFDERSTYITALSSKGDPV